jgi:hypothetical protein
LASARRDRLLPYFPKGTQKVPPPGAQAGPDASPPAFSLQLTFHFIWT